MRRSLLFVILIILTACTPPTVNSVADVTIQQNDLPNGFMPLEGQAPDWGAIAGEAIGTDPAATFAYVNRRTQVLGFSAENFTAPSLNAVSVQVNEGIAPDALVSGQVPLPEIQMEILGEDATGVTFTTPAEDLDGDPYIMRVNTVVLQRGDVIAAVVVTFEDRTAAPVDIYAMARLLDARLQRLNMGE